MRTTRNLSSSEELEPGKICTATDENILNAKEVETIENITNSLDVYGNEPFPKQRYVVDEVGLHLKGDGEERVFISHYSNEGDISTIDGLMESTLSEPYSIWTYRFFVHQYPDLTYMAFDRRSNKCVAAILSKVGLDCEDGKNEGYIGMLAVDPAYRRIGLGTRLVRKVLDVMLSRYNCLTCYVDTEFTNVASLKLYESFGFIRDSRFKRYYLNRNDAFRLRLHFQPGQVEINNGKKEYIHKPSLDFKKIMTESALARDEEK